MNENDVMVDTTVENEVCAEESNQISAGKTIAICTAAGAVGGVVVTAAIKLGKRIWSKVKAKIAERKASKEEAVEAEEENK